MKILLSWLLVALPLAWGVKQSVKKAMPLFLGNGPAPASSVVK
jgi:hypothetical protein